MKTVRSRVAHIQSILFDHVSHAQSFMQLLMKGRNGLPWSQEDKIKLRLHLRNLARTLPALGLFILPGGSLLLPALAWFLDRRRDSATRLMVAAPAIAAASRGASEGLGPK